MFENYRKFETTFAGRPLVVETGKTCGLSNGSCWVRYGETVVMANVTASVKPREGVDFFPLSVDYEERLYAVGKIPGSFTKREGKPSEKAIRNRKNREKEREHQRKRAKRKARRAKNGR